MTQFHLLISLLCFYFPVTAQITGDFNGDKRTDTLTFSLQEMPSGRRIALPKNKNMEQWVKKHHPVGVLQSTRISQLYVGNMLQPVTGLLYLQNCGDVDGDGGDEIGLVKNAFDYSSVNLYDLYSFKKDTWMRLYSFEIREYDIPKAIADSSYFIRRSDNGKYIIRSWDLADETEVVVDFNH